MIPIIVDWVGRGGRVYVCSYKFNYFGLCSPLIHRGFYSPAHLSYAYVLTKGTAFAINSCGLSAIIGSAESLVFTNRYY